MCVDETPPTDLNSLCAPAAPLPVPPRKPFAKRAAKMALWSPFAGLFILIVFALIVDKSNSRPHRMIGSIVVAVCWLIWWLDRSGIMALRRTKTEGRKGVSGRALIGVTLNLLFLGVTIWGAVLLVRLESELKKMQNKSAENEAEKVRARVGGVKRCKKS